MARRARVDACRGGQVPRLEAVVVGRRVRDGGVVGLEDDAGDRSGVTGELAEGATSGHGFVRFGELLALVGGGGGVGEEVGGRGGVLLCVGGEEGEGCVGGGGEDAVRGAVDGDVFDGPAVAEELDARGEGARVLVVLVDAHGVVHARGDDLLVGQPLCALQAGDAAAVVGCFRRRQHVARHVPYPHQSVVACRQDSFLSALHTASRPCARPGRGGKNIHGRNPVVVLEARDVERRDQRARVFDVQRGFGRDAILGEEFVDGGPQELAIDEDVEGNGLVVRSEETVYEGRKLRAAQGRLHEQRAGFLRELYRRIAGAQPHGHLHFGLGVHVCCRGIGGGASTQNPSPKFLESSRKFSNLA